MLLSKCVQLQWNKHNKKIYETLHDLMISGDKAVKDLVKEYIKNNSDEKNSHSRKSQFIIYQASLLQQKMTESQNDVSNDNSGI